ncbi:oxidoreductase [Allosaccharopolyspora coralli]|uniref:oxidoreductase n=1 Tax=Allosaccharopolyspora coralli TaxID=2665642 RepID=UPI001E4FA286|nr:oxidoreductase [Allosaccharopolyspora coralli]
MTSTPGGGLVTLPGRDPLTLRRVGFGAMQLCGPGVLGPPADRAGAVRILRRAVELGVNHIDTSDFYGPWVVNELIAEALHPYRDELVLATKIGAYRDQQGGWLPSGHPDALRAQVHDNLRRLKVEVLDVVYLRHLADRAGVDFADQLGALTELRDAGLLRHIGLSNVTLEQFERARGLTDVSVVQNLYNVVNRSDAALLTRTAECGMGFVPFFPLGSGFQDSRARGHSVLAGVADRHEATSAQISLAWLLQTAPHVVLIPGTTSPSHLEENTSVGDIELTPDDVAALDALVADGDTLEPAH